MMVNHLVGGDWNQSLEHDWFIYIYIHISKYDLGMSSFQLTNSNLFQRGRLKPPTSMGSSVAGWFGGFPLLGNLHMRMVNDNY